MLLWWIVTHSVVILENWLLPQCVNKAQLPVHAVMACVLCRGVGPPFILNLTSEWRWVVSFRPWPLYRWRKDPKCTWNNKVCMSQSWSRHVVPFPCLQSNYELRSPQPSQCILCYVPNVFCRAHSTTSGNWVISERAWRRSHYFCSELQQVRCGS
jgi:hypothetical protein